MRNPMVFWGTMALLQFFWLLIGWGCYRYVKLASAKLQHAKWFMFGAVFLGNILMLSFNHLWPHLRWRGTMGTLLFTAYAVPLTLFWTLFYQMGKRWLPMHQVKYSILAGMPLLWAALIGAGLYLAYVPTTVHYSVSIDKTMPKPIKIALVADTHLGQFIGKRHLDALHAILQREQADILLLAGDVMDDLPDDYRHLNMHPHMQQLHAPMGKYVVLGNHDNYRHVQADIVHDLQAAGFTVLRDEHLEVPEQLIVVGRRDKVEPRKSAQDVVPQSDLPVIVMDHQPVGAEMQAISEAQADVIVAGHTHGGQIFPMTALIGWFQDYPYGHYRINDSQLVVTSGLGLWGLPFRMGTRSEVVIIELTGKYSPAN